MSNMNYLILCIRTRQLEYAKIIASIYNCEIEISNKEKTIGRLIRDNENKFTYLIIIGDTEVMTKTITIWRGNGIETISMKNHFRDDKINKLLE